jgi:16S rRNA processing protein RimM
MEKYIQIGFVGKTHGVNGELKYNVEDEYWEDFFDAQVLFVEIAKRKTPFFVEEITTGGLALLKFEDIQSREDAIPLTNKELYMRESDLAERKPEELNLDEMLDLLTGFMVVDEEVGEVGVIKEVLEFPQQVMAVLDYQEKEILIPLNDEFIQSIDQKNKGILMNLPEGLLEL